MFEIASEFVICFIVATLIGAIIGYILGRSTCQKSTSTCTDTPEATHELHIDNQKKPTLKTTTSQIKEEVKEQGVKPTTLLTEARNGEKDNLQRIKGVGPVLEKLLNETGIFHFDQLANLTAKEAIWLDIAMAFPGRVERENWIGQSQKFASESDKEES